MNKKVMIDTLIEHYSGGNKAKFAELIGTNPKNITAWSARGTFDSELIYARCEGLSPEWLLTGEGPMLTKDRAEEKKEEASKALPATRPGEGIPLLPISAMAGALTSDQTVLDYECEHYVVPAFKGADFLIPVKGSSMYPKYSSGDIVACKRVPMSGLFFQWNKVYVIDTTQGPLIKRIKPGSSKDTVLIVSDNEKYDPFELPVEEIHAVALVIGVIRLE